ncbi:DNA repair protein rad32 [Neolecta irregularis DAH-3]|uniref:Double-strand break repair protein n=1 Tax=Neolecta irregularis (strain DAH-3) TaxID=1198029 RepID=A0A1U7LW53_NEOID|nr:DNA repair protein rad32 [Neolecta irregularis DAH-3]|eukprot:OLL26864.1 DNA repair protein rad32 [Neolecta irregularis DAH-3]
MMSEFSKKDTIRILIASDNHVGYLERDSVRGNDSFRSFEEIMQLAKDKDVDMVLLGGDLFHDNKPSRKSLFEAMKSLRLNCLGPKPCELQMLSDMSNDSYDPSFAHLNYEDLDINVAIPVFSIHGNHDDPAGEGRLCALDILQAAGLINYFGRVPENDNITVRPVLLQKGRTKLALYGLGNVRDERLYRTFREGNVRYMRPLEDQDNWFNICVVHQNHASHTDTGYLPESFLQDFMDIILWGHEHECLIDPRQNDQRGFYVIQPGSSVATSLCMGESIKKHEYNMLLQPADCRHVGILSVRGKERGFEKIPLRTVRPFAMREIVLAEYNEIPATGKNMRQVREFLERQVEGMIKEAITDWRKMIEDYDDPSSTEVSNQPPLPLIRLRVEYTGVYEVENPQRFSHRFIGRVANSNDIIQYHRKKATTRKSKNVLGFPEFDELVEHVTLSKLRVETLVREFLDAQTLVVLAENGLGDAVSQFVEKDDKNAVNDFVKDSVKHQISSLLKSGIEDDDLEEALEKQKAAMKEKIEKKAGKHTNIGNRDSWDDFEMGGIHSNRLDSDDDEPELSHPAKSTRRSAAKKGSVPKKAPAKRLPAKKPTSRRGRRTTPSPAESNIPEEEDVEIIEDTPPPPRRTNRPTSPTSVTSNKTFGRKATLDFAQPPKQPSFLNDSDEDDFVDVEPSAKKRSARS